jgi:hypothetical protein
MIRDPYSHEQIQSIRSLPRVGISHRHQRLREVIVCLGIVVVVTLLVMG